MEVTVQEHAELVAGLRREIARDCPEVEVVLIETHISSVLLAGGFAYKIKKPLDLGFLDLSTLERRRFCCQEEIRLNRRLAPDIYLEVVAVTGSPQKPVLGGDGEPLDYVVKMRRFPEAGLLSDHLDLLDAGLAERIAHRIAGFHRQIAVAGAGMEYGEPGVAFQPMQDNFAHIRELVDDPRVLARLEVLERWTLERFRELGPVMAARKADGFVRECHGDLHLGNIALEQGEPLIFDGIEFNPHLRWIDTMSELAFLLMDLDEKGRPDISGLLLNGYLEQSGDYPGLGLLRFYQVYRAMVRAKVSAIRLGQPGVDPGIRASVMADLGAYLGLAESYTRPPRPGLLITCGLSGSGKSHHTRHLLMEAPLVRIRSDVERKRLAGLEIEADSGSGLESGIYDPEFSRRTYVHLSDLAGMILRAGFSVVVDATFLKRSQREWFQTLAEELGVPFGMLDFQAPEQILQERIRQRSEQGGDASEADLAVLQSQLESAEPLTDDERRAAITVSPGRPLDIQAIRARWVR
jgi:aminoglycoside phosphotransferase family enzyme/predicted kinase